MKYRNDLKKRILAGLLAGAALCLAAPAAQAANVIPNTQLPTGGQVMAGNVTLPDIVKPGGNPNGATSATITQNSQNAVIKWDSFNIGANATVTFQKGEGYTGSGNFNTLNYDISGSMSQIYGTINAQGGNIYIVNPAGVEIGNSAQINTGSLYVSNKNLDKALENVTDKANPNIANIMAQGTTTDAALMSLGNINATNVTFDGGRIVIDTERLKDANGDKKLDAGNIIVRTNDASNVVIGYDAYEETFNNTVDANTYKDKQKIASGLATVLDTNGNKVADFNAYMWVEDVEQLQAINTNLSGNYALRNSIDATATQDWNDGAGFASLGTTEAFTGKFDGLDYNIFNLNINRADENYVGLFGVVGSGAVINNVTLVGGSITGKNNVGALAGSVQGGAHISNVTNSASVTGASNVGGIVGASIGTDENHTVYDGLINTGTIISSGTDDGKGGTVSNAGGLIGYLEEGELGGASYNLGAVKGQTDESGNMTVGYNVGGLVGHAVNSIIGNKDTIDEDGQAVQGTTVYNRLNVTGAYNVGGIVGNMEGSTVQNAENSGDVTSTGYLDGTYMYHTDRNSIEGYDAATKTASIGVQVANVGGIAGSSSNKSRIENALNLGDVSSNRQEGNEYYDAGNVGGVVGSAVDTNITNATNRENEIRGAHNVGGIAGYFSGTGVVSNGINDGGDIMATGARATGTGSLVVNGFAQEHIRPGAGGVNEHFNIGNMGGIVGYLEGDNVSITNSANRGTVHTYGEYTSSSNVPDWAKAANVGGIVGKIDHEKANTMEGIKNGRETAAVSDSYNTGDVRGYTGVGGIAGLMYNGAITGSYNEGYLSSTRQTSTSDSNNIDALNMGGIVGDTTEMGSAKAVLYDVYNKGQIGDATYTYFGRHIGGIAGRLTGDIEKAYNTGDIYNGFSVVGGIAGWMVTGSITNSFNTGNVTVYNQNASTSSQVGGIVGATGGNVSLTNVYNLGTLRSFQAGTAKENSLGGIIGQVRVGGKATITNAYTTGNLYINGTGYIGSMVGYRENGSVSLDNTYYIEPEETGIFGTPTINNDVYNAEHTLTQAEATENQDNWDDFKFTAQNNGAVTGDGEWRWYKGTTPILNAFLPNAEKYFSNNPQAMDGIDSIQYGTAYDPLLTIIKANEKGKAEGLSFNWQDLGINNDAGLAVYGAGLTLNDFMSTGGSGYFAGLIYSDGALNINAHTSGETHDAANTNVTGNVALGSASELYGSSVTIDADGQVTIYGSVTATGNGTTDKNNPAKDNSGSISITGGSVDVYGQLTSAKNEEGENTVFVPGIDGMADHWSPVKEGTSVSNPKDAMNEIGDWFGHTTVASAVTGNISITANDAEDGHVNVYYGNKGEGIVTTGGDLTVNASGDIYMDSDLSIGGDLSLKAGYKEGEGKPAAGSEAVLDISNIGKVQASNDDDASHTSNYYLNEFLTHFADEKYNITLGGDKTKIAVDMWGDGAFDLTKYDYEGNALANRLDQLHINGETEKGKDYTYIWVGTGEQLAGIQDYKDKHSDSNILSYNFALKNDIDASNVRGYKAIGTGSAYTGTFDGRDNRIIGLTMTGNNAGLFDTIGKNADGTQVGTVEDLRVYSGTFSGTDSAGAVAGVNNGKISNVTAFGNVVDVKNTSDQASYAGGIAGTNSGSIDNASAIGTATQSSKDIAENVKAVAGGIAGLNSGTISNSSANSAVNASAGNATALGGVAGVNEGKLDNVDSLGVTTGVYKVEGKDTLYSDNVGGIAGTNSGTVTNVYNESIVSGRDNVGGIFGENSGADVSNVANAADVTGEAGDNDTSDYVGGLAGSNSGSITNGRNNGEITGNNYVGGLVGANRVGADGKKPELTNLVNDSAAAITGDNYVGGIAGSNEGTISANAQELINRGTITGVQYVGGVAGENTGKIENTNNDVDLHVKEGAKDAKYFGGVAGINTDSGTITNATNHADVSADGASYVGGVVGKNDGVLSGMNGNYGTVSGKDFVGGVAGENTQALSGVNAVNQGDVTAREGGAGGIFAVNSGEITDSTFTSSGTVSGTTGTGASGTGGIFGVNEADIENSTLENKGYTDEDGVFHDSIVTGTSNTGGLIGINTGDVSTSSLKNEADIKVEGDNVSNIGGLIGMNTGDITGGRTEADNTDVGYYKYQIYNNGTITVEGDGSNIGGLIGNNAQENGKTGSLTAGYNTGAIVAKNGTNVGGIAGTNAGTLDQVFNTVIIVNEDSSTASGSITGHTNVGGIAGTNTGTIFNAYNTSTVNNGASIAGTNSGTISNVYGSGTLVGSGSDSVSNDYDISDTSGNKDWKDSDSYTGFDFDGDDAVWKIYEGSTNPLLKVFLTQLTVNDVGDLVYNGYDQNLNLGELIGEGKDNITGPAGMENPFDAYYNTLKPNGSNGDSELLYNVGEQVNAGKYQNWLASGQISAGANGTVNNLGYDIVYKDDTVGEVGKAQISITLDDINRTYGNSTITSGQAQGVGSGAVHVSDGTNDYGYSYTITNQTLTDKMKEQLEGMTFGNITDEAVDKLADGKTTADVGTHKWSASFGLGEDSLANNFTFGEEQSSITVTEDKSHVDRANIEIIAKPEQVYVDGTPQFSGTDISSVLVNGDTIPGGSYQYGTEKLPADTSVPGDSVIGIHFGSAYLNGDSDASAWDSVMNGLFKNYNVTFKPGTLTVLALPDGMPDIPEIPGIENHWNGLLGDNPWDRNRDFRERKAEIHYIAGGMTL